MNGLGTLAYRYLKSNVSGDTLGDILVIHSETFW